MYTETRQYKTECDIFPNIVTFTNVSIVLHLFIDFFFVILLIIIFYSSSTIYSFCVNHTELRLMLLHYHRNHLCPNYLTQKQFDYLDI